MSTTAKMSSHSVIILPEQVHYIEIFCFFMKKFLEIGFQFFSILDALWFIERVQKFQCQ